MFCANCGGTVSVGIKFCPKCGMKVGVASIQSVTTGGFSSSSSSPSTLAGRETKAPWWPAIICICVGAPLVFIVVVAIVSTSENADIESRGVGSVVITERDKKVGIKGDQSGTRREIVTDLKEYGEMHALKQKQLTDVQYSEFRQSEEGRRVEVILYVNDVWQLLGDLCVTASCDEHEGAGSVWCNIKDGTGGGKLGPVIKRLRKGEAIKVTGVFSGNQGLEISAQKIEIVK